jgi:hypothetical protein
MTLSHYEVVPAHVAGDIISAQQKEISKQESD